MIITDLYDLLYVIPMDRVLGNGISVHTYIVMNVLRITHTFIQLY